MNIENTSEGGLRSQSDKNSVFTQNQNTNTATTEYVLQSSQYPKTLSSIIGMNLDDFVKLNDVPKGTLISSAKIIKVPSNINFKSDVLRPRGTKGDKPNMPKK